MTSTISLDCRLCVFRDTLLGLAKKGEMGLLERETQNQMKIFNNILMLSLSDTQGALSINLNHITCIGLGNRIPSRILSSFYKLTKAMRIIKAFHPHMIRAYGLAEGFYACIVGKLLNVCVVVSIHANYRMVTDLELSDSGFLMRTLNLTFLGIAEKVVYKLSRILLVVNEEIQEHFLTMGMPKNKIVVVRRPVELSMFESIQKDHKHSEIIIYIGRLSREKNVESLIKAMSIIVEKRPFAQLKIIGDGPLHEKLKSLSLRLNLGSNVFFKGFIPQKEIPALLSEAEVFVLPSLTEGKPKALLEAMATGLPIVASNIRSIREIVNDKEAILVEPIPHSIASAIMKMFEDKKKAQELGFNAKRASKRFNIESVLNEELDIYRKLLHQPPCIKSKRQ